MAAVCEVGILFADIAGSTRIYERLGDTRAHAVINQCFQIMGECVQAHRGVVVKTIGDELMAAFSAANQPFSCAIDIRRKFGEMPPLPLSEPPLPPPPPPVLATPSVAPALLEVALPALVPPNPPPAPPPPDP